MRRHTGSQVRNAVQKRASRGEGRAPGATGSRWPWVGVRRGRPGQSPAEGEAGAVKGGGAQLAALSRAKVREVTSIR